MLTIAGSDSSAGAGIQADLKTIEAGGGHAVTAITAVTAQNTRGVRRVDRLPIGSIRAQLEAVFDDFDVAAVKTGMLVDDEVVSLVGEVLRVRRPRVVVCDPVLLSTSGHELLDEAGLNAFHARILPFTTVVTPNVPEAERLSGETIVDIPDAERAARKLLASGVGAVLVKGGHLPGATATDVLVDRTGTRMFSAPFLESGSTHGTGCVMASALATRLALDFPLRDAVEWAKEFTRRAIASTLR